MGSKSSSRRMRLFLQLLAANCSTVRSFVAETLSCPFIEQFHEEPIKLVASTIVPSLAIVTNGASNRRVYPDVLKCVKLVRIHKTYIDPIAQKTNQFQ